MRSEGAKNRLSMAATNGPAVRACRALLATVSRSHQA